ncbi:MAG: double-strand break repair helicase AddA [Phenylobacterium sp.]|uniref:double-strand break repair helicase AddA n=3 Tax=Phenylobacterium sp. TaxID=1871053 RepID=UPI0025CFCF06|nr:double-strand break repair helicase AddA [Phenylobacterium sp.]MCA6223722.1 double-strand break repair helicase AddA [Phenylobacterium sp.]MCA6235642.1 double-strand break repair helicase AddA [Phenylobacterium sp.]MCA6251980.1 double-strand break repair helicase AddA [Phenylobacterium sp.]MCA6257315.1 double-strand break repair helicase AddA [Phenylobacterium sp.]MCA6274315.1 double-strand break repair helicase AddA [Phenylobacterium sp.]
MTRRDDDPQARAADPRISAFVTANAGSGKTKTLIDRVARLLLAGAAPDEILCVTYTKAAAAEMQTRLFELLGDWSVLPDDRLAAALARLEGRSRKAYDPNTLSAARALFARALETPGGLRIQTLHAFCEKLLRRFPLEAGISPGFEVLDDLAASQLKRGARTALARRALDAEGGRIAEAYARLSVDFDHGRFEGLFETFAARAGELSDWFAAQAAGRGIEAAVWFALTGSPEPVDPEAIRREMADMSDGMSPGEWLEVADALARPESSKTDKKRAEDLRRDAGKLDFEAVRALLTTKEMTAKVWITSAKSLKPHPRLSERLVREADRILTVEGRRRIALAGQRTLDILLLAEAWLAAYEIEKWASGKLDFGDLIDRTLALTGRADMAAWVLYKLDQNLSHVLVDEAQDTSPAQWSILSNLTGDFFAGDGRRESGLALRRSLFVVGDEKQSIYSFQGASPDRLETEFRAYSARAQAAGATFERIELALSWRSTREVLGFVDAVFVAPESRFALMGGRDGEPPPIAHQTVRDHPGGIDLWDLVPPPETEERGAWTDPPDSLAANSSTRVLAARIAAEIRRMVEAGEAVGKKGEAGVRPADWGDFIVLVRRRGTLFDEILLELKRQGVPVGGADRLKLADHILFDDLRALVRFVLFPADSLTLAALLRSPFCEVSDQGLYDLAYGRGTASLWETLVRRVDEAPPGEARQDWAQARNFLAAAIAAADQSPYDFIVGQLESTAPCGRTHRQRLLTRLGREAEEALGVFLEKTLELEMAGARSLEAFAADLDGLDVDVKREMDAEGAREVRVMTAHGAKGLEAPVIFLPDMTFNAQGGSGLTRAQDGAFLWLGASGDDCPVQAEAREAAKAEEEKELKRLLYVGLTRARDRLVLCGVLPGNRLEANLKGWWGAVRDAFEGPLKDKVRRIDRGDYGLFRLGEDPQALGREAPAEEVTQAPPAPPWLSRPAAAEPLARLASPSDLGDAAPVAAVSPLAGTPGMGRFRRGELIHRLLQVLPDLPGDVRPDAARRLLRKEAGLSDPQVEEMSTAALGVLGHPDFAFLFGPGSRAEAAIIGGSGRLPPGVRISGRIDRLVVRPDEVLFADFKTNRPAPASIEAADPAYLRQLAMYWAVLSELYPDRPVRAALVWTDGPLLTPAPEALLREALDRLYRAA